MKKLFLLSLFVSFVFNEVNAQVSINTDGSAPDNSAMLEVKSTTKGVLLPRMTLLQRAAIVNPSEGLMVVCTNCSYYGTSVLSIFLSGQWQNINSNCDVPFTPSEGTNLPGITQIVWNWNPTPITTGYKWNTVNDYSSAIDLGNVTTYTETGLTCNSYYVRYVWAYNNCGTYDWGGELTERTLQVQPNAPVVGTHLPGFNQIVWNWNVLPGATGYKWNTTNNYNTATDLGASNTKTEENLLCGTNYTRYVWAYTTCGNSLVSVLTQSTVLCATCGTPITDVRDGKSYSTVLIGTQCWMGQNLNYGIKTDGVLEQTNNSTPEKYCYDDLESNCDVYGGLYQWGEMVQYLNGGSNTTSWSPTPSSSVKGICPTGWHIPSINEAVALADFLGGESVAGGAMKETGLSHWRTPNTDATNSSGFTGLPGGSNVPGYGFSSLSDYTYLRIKDQDGGTPTTNSIDGYLHYDAGSFSILSRGKNEGQSVRCIMD